MLGVIIGDIIGSRFEFMTTQERDVELFHPACDFTDDTVCTAAIVLGTKKSLENIKFHKELEQKHGQSYRNEFKGTEEERIKKIYAKNLREVCLFHPLKGYGKRFIDWLNNIDMEAYGSLGNGCLMRVSPVVMLSQTLEEALFLGQQATEITHEHKDALIATEQYIKILWLCKTFVGSQAELIATLKLKIQSDYPDIKTVEEYHKEGGYHVLAPDTLKRALTSVIEANTFEEVIKNTLYIGSDTDTTAAIAGAIAELIYGIPKEYLDKLENYFNFYKIDLLKLIVSQYENKGFGETATYNLFKDSHQFWYKKITTLVLEDPTAQWDPLADPTEEEYYSAVDNSLNFSHAPWWKKLLLKSGIIKH